ncbi:hypothetical protein JX266_007770 [Neoarthrinium moseri]|nr:hypothetical protein JX266_007770 [Neoarthrinium moseri]
MRLSSSLASLHLAGTRLTGLVSAYPAHTESQVEAREPEFGALDSRGLTLKIGKEPGGDAKCPKTTNPGFEPQPEHKYTMNQIKQAFLQAAKLAADSKQIGDNKYPHDFGNGEKLPFKCGKNQMEFIILPNGKVYDGSGNTRDMPDRVVFEYSKSKKEFKANYCGVMRHGPTRDFLHCKD